MDGLPIFSQTKSLIQFICNDSKGAKRTQENFSKLCPVISQGRSVVEYIKGNKKSAKQTQIEFGNFILSIVSSIPVIGHVKGGIHYALGDDEKGDASMKAASHTTAVLAGGAGGFILGGPPGAVAGGISAGVAIDSTITGVDSAVHSEFRPYGILEPLNNPRDPGKWCDAAGGVVLDGIAGRCAGKVVQKIQVRSAAKNVKPIDVVDTVTKETLIPKPVAAVASQVKLLVKSSGYKLYIAGVKFASDFVTNKLDSFSDPANVFPQSPNSEETSGSNIEPAITFKHNGTELEIYYLGKMIFLDTGSVRLFVNEHGGMERIEDDVFYGIQPNGSFEKISQGSGGGHSWEMESNSSVYEDASELWPQNLNSNIHFIYDSNSGEMNWNDGSDEHFNLPTGARRQAEFQV